MTHVLNAPHALLRISVQSEGRRLDIGVPARLPLVELMPGLARNLGVLDPTMAHAGYALQRADGTVLDASRGAGEQGVDDGELLTLTHGDLLVQPRIYDDIVEAVSEATAAQHAPWTPKDNARTALAASLALLGVCAILLLTAGPSLFVGALIAGGGAIVLLAVAAVVARLGQPETCRGLGLAAAGFGAIAGYLAVPGSPMIWGWPLAAAGTGALIIGGAAFALSPERPEWQLVPIVGGAVIAVTGAVAAVFPPSHLAAYTMLIAIAGTLGNALPWLALSSTRIRAISPQSDAEVFQEPEPLDSEDVRRRVASGLRVLVALRVALGLAMLGVTPLVASSSPAGAALCALAFLGMMFPSRQSYSRGAVASLMSLGTAGLAVTGVAAALAQPALHTVMLVALILAIAILVTVTLLAPRVRTRLTRLADLAEVVLLSVLLPLGVIAAGWA